MDQYLVVDKMGRLIGPFLSFDSATEWGLANVHRKFGVRHIISTGAMSGCYDDDGNAGHGAP